MTDSHLNKTGLDRVWQKIKSYIATQLNQRAGLSVTSTGTDVYKAELTQQSDVFSVAAPVSDLVNVQWVDRLNGIDVNAQLATKAYVDGRDPFMLLDFNQAVSGGVLTPCTDDTMPTSAATGRIDIALREELQADWAIASLAKYEVKNGSTRVPAFPVASFSMTQQTVLRVLFKTAGTVTKDFTSINGAILLKHR